MITTQDGQNKDSRSGIALFAKNDSKCCTRFKISCKWEYKGSGHGGSSGGQGGLSIMPAWEKWYEKDFSKVERPGGYVTSVSLFVPSTDASGEVDIPFGEEKKVFALSAYIHAGVWGSSAELEESGSIQCSAICASGE
jgi:hypothetical protein